MVRSLPLSSLLGLSLLAACSNGVSNTEDQTPLTTPLYSPSTGAIPLPNDLLFAGTADLTLNIPVANPTDLTDPKVALNTLDGWSVGAPFPLVFTGSGVDETSMVAGVGVRIFEVTTGPGPGGAPIGGPVTGVTRELTAGEFELGNGSVTATPANSWEVRPTAPLKPSTTYMVVLTNTILGADGRAIAADSEYVLARNTTLYPPDHPFAQLQLVVLNLETVAEAAGVDRDSIVMSFHFTTQSVGKALDVLAAIAALGDPAEQATIDALAASGIIDVSSGTAPEIASASISGVSLFGSTSLLGLVGLADIYMGSVELPYFLSAGDNATSTGASFDTGPLTNPWSARYPFIGGTEVNLTAFNPLPHPTGATGTEKAPLMISVPNVASKPPGGWPVTIFQHGITANRSSLLGLADFFALGAFPQVIVAMDLPLHGMAENLPATMGGGVNPFFAGYLNGTTRERTFGLDLLNETTGAPGPDTVIDSSGAHMINLQNLAVSRDNFRQSVSDLMHLHSALDDLKTELDAFLGAPSLDFTQVTFVGHSLGGMVGIPFLARTPAAIPSSLGMPGGGIAKMLDASQTLGPVVQAGLAGAGVVKGTADYESFMWAAQTAVDTTDPIHHIAAVSARGTPVHMIEVVGGGVTGLPDAVVPKDVPTAPLSGTEPLARVGGLESVSTTTGDGVNPVQGIVRFLEGTHASLVSPGSTTEESAAYFEMISQMISFAASGGTLLTITNGSVVQ